MAGKESVLVPILAKKKHPMKKQVIWAFVFSARGDH
jgi:hypothetical protein